MEDHDQVKYQLKQTRNELNNLRKTLYSLRAKHNADVEKLKEILGSIDQKSESIETPSPNLHNQWKCVGRIKSWFTTKNGTPRQGTVSPLSRASIHLDKEVFTNSEHSLEGLQEYSHIWIMFLFDQNSPSSHCRAKVAPPRLNGKRVGLFSTRSPHRPNPIGLTLARLHSIQGNVVHISGIDILDGTIILDIKPFIPQYDYPTDIKPVIPKYENSSGIESFSPLHQDDCFGDRQQTTLIPSVIESDNAHSVENINLFEDKEFRTTVSPKDYNVNKSNDLDIGSGVSHLVLNQNYLTEKCSYDSSPIEENNLEVNENACLRVEVPVIVNTEENISRLSATTNSSLTNRINNPICPSDRRQHVTRKTTNNAKFLASNDQAVNSNFSEIEECSEILTASWIDNPPAATLNVIFNPIALDQMKKYSSDSTEDKFRLEFLNNSEELKNVIAGVLAEDPRSTYRRQRCSDLLYYFVVDCAHVTAWFIDGNAEVLRVNPTETNLKRVSVV